MAMFVRVQRNGERTYLLVVENEWVGGRVKQKVLHRLGRLDILQETGKLDALMLSMQRFSEKLAVLGAQEKGQVQATRTSKIGPALIFERLWRTLRIPTVLGDLLRTRRFEFSVERAVFLTVLHRLFAPGSDRAAETWKADYRIEGVEEIDLHQLYRAMGWLGQPLAADQQRGATPFSPRCTKDVLEERLFAARRDLFTQLDIVFFDTTSIYFEGEGGETIGQYGHTKDHRSDLKQMVVGVVLDHEGNPLCCEMWPGNTADVKSLVPVVHRLKERFHIGTICIVADRGMISEETKQQIEANGWQYILGVRMRGCTEAREHVLARGGRYQEVFAKSQKADAPSPLKVKEVVVGGRRYIVCLNEDQAAKDRRDRQVIVTALRGALKQGDKSLIGNRGYRRFVQTSSGRFSVNEQKVRDEARYDGKWVLTTSTDLPTRDVALKYKQLWTVESIFRSMKSLLKTRPIYHKCDDTIRGHVFCSFLALLLRKELQDRLERKGWSLEWTDVIRDLDNLVEMDISVSGKSYTIRSETKETTDKVFKACGVALPPTLKQH
jgi:transposase